MGSQAEGRGHASQVGAAKKQGLLVGRVGLDGLGLELWTFVLAGASLLK